MRSKIQSFLQPLKFRLFGKPDPKEYSATLGIGSVVPCQIEAYFLTLNKYVDFGDKVLDVGCGLGYGLNILSIKAEEVFGVDIDPGAINYCENTILGRNPKLKYLSIFDGYHLDFNDNYFDVVTIVDVLEHVEIFEGFLKELLRVTKKGIFISTPNRRPEYTNSDGTPKNYWHLREWNYEELNSILIKLGKVDWNFLNGPFSGPFLISTSIEESSLTLSPFLLKLIK